MAAGKRRIINKTFSLLRGAILVTLKIYRAGPDKDIVISLEIAIAFHKTGIPGPVAAPAQA